MASRTLKDPVDKIRGAATMLENKGVRVEFEEEVEIVVREVVVGECNKREEE